MGFGVKREEGVGDVGMGFEARLNCEGVKLVTESGDMAGVGGGGYDG